MIQSLENFVSMAIQGTQVPKYTKHTLFLYFSDFTLFILKKKKKLNNQTKIDKQHERRKKDAYA